MFTIHDISMTLNCVRAQFQRIENQRNDSNLCVVHGKIPKYSNIITNNGNDDDDEDDNEKKTYGK